MTPEQRLDVPLDPAAVHCQGRGFYPPLRFREVEVAQFGDRHRRSGGMALGGWVRALGRGNELVAGNLARFAGVSVPILPIRSRRVRPSAVRYCTR